MPKYYIKSGPTTYIKDAPNAYVAVEQLIQNMLIGNTYTTKLGEFILINESGFNSNFDLALNTYETLIELGLIQ